MVGVAVSFALFLTVRAFARPPPTTMTKEWQEASNEYLKVSFLALCYQSPLVELPLR
jgi:cytochrome c oxidase subunit 4